MRWLRHALVGALSVVAWCNSPAWAGDVNVELQAWFPNVSGSAQDDALGAADTVSLKGDLGLQSENIPEVRATWDFGRRSQLRLAFCNFGGQGSNVINRTFNYGGSVYVVGDRVNSNYNFNVFESGYHWRLFQWPTVQIGFLAQLNVLWGQTALTVPARGVNERISGILPLPSLGATFAWQPWEQFHFFGEVSGMTAGEYGHLLEFEAGAEVQPAKGFLVKGGYRFMEAKAEDNPDFFELRIQGPFMETGWTF